MKNSVYRIALDMHKDASQYSLHAKRYDTARTIRATFMDGGKPFDVSGFYPILTGKNAAGESIYESCSVAENSVVYDFTATLTGIPGLVECEIQLYNQDPKQGGAVMITSARFSVVVAEAVYQEGDIKAEERAAFTKLLADTTAAMGAANAAAEEVLRRADSGEFDGAPGDKGDPGAPGKTPVNGVDYNTPEEREALLEDLQIKAGIKQTASGTALNLPDSADCRLQAFTLDGGNAGESVNIAVSGKNLFNFDRVVGSIKQENFTLNMTAPGVQYDIFTGLNGNNHKVTAENMGKLPILPAGTYTISYNRLTDSGYMRVWAVADDGTPKGLITATVDAGPRFCKFNFTLTSDSRITIRRSTSTTMTVNNLQIERGDVATAFAPYRAPQAATVEATGGKVDVLAQHPDLRSLYPTTVVSNDKDIPMSVTYMADTEAFINKKFAELATALLGN